MPLRLFLVIILICLYTLGEKSLGLEAVRLSALKVKQTAMITKVNRLVDDTEQPDLVAIRLESLS